MHEHAKRLLKRYQGIYGTRGLHPEVRYYGGGLWKRGRPLQRSLELDVVEGSRTSPTAIYDYKFGTVGLQPRYARKVLRTGGFSEDVLIVEIRP